jgi:hypothetical protein
MRLVRWDSSPWSPHLKTAVNDKSNKAIGTTSGVLNTVRQDIRIMYGALETMIRAV